MGPCIVNVFKQDQQDAMLHNGIYYYKCCTYSNSPTIAVRSIKSSTNTLCCVYSFELLMMGGGTAWNI